MVKVQPVPTGLQSRVASMVQNRGLRKASEMLGINEKTVLRLATGVPCQPGTIALVGRTLEERREL